MALVTNGFDLSIVLVDSGGNTATLRYDLRAADYATAVLARTDIVGRLQAITNAAIKKATISESLIEDAFAYPAGAEIENIAVVSGMIENHPEKSWSIRIPAPKDDLFTATTGPGRNIVDPLDTDLQEYLLTWGTAAGEAWISDGETIDATATVKGHRIHRANSYG